MATLTQPVHSSNTTFSPIKSSLEDATIISAACAPVSKIKPATVSTKLSNVEVDNKLLINGSTSPIPQPTSQV